MLRWLTAVVAVAAFAFVLGEGRAAAQTAQNNKDNKEAKRASDKPEAGGFFADVVALATRGGVKLPAGVPSKVGRVLAYVDKNDEAPDGYQGGRNFGNFERRLPQTDRRGKSIRYREWDVNPLVPGRNRGAERMITGSDGSAWYTADHYETFKRIR